MPRAVAQACSRLIAWRWNRHCCRILSLLALAMALATACSSSSDASASTLSETLHSAATENGPYAKDPVPGTHTQTPEHIRFQRVSVEDGLSQSTVNCILQDSRGFMWYGTNDGLNRYDGYAFEVYRHDPDNPQSPGHNRITAISEDEEGMLWIGTYGGGLDRLDLRTGLWRHYAHDPGDPHSLSHNQVRSLYRDRSGMLWVATHGGGLNRFDRQSEQFTHYAPDPQCPSCLRDWLIDSVFEDREGRLWVGSNNEGLAYLDRATGRFTHYRHDPGDPNSLSTNLMLAAILQDEEEMLWVATFDGLNRFGPKTGRATRYLHDPSDVRTLSHGTVNALHYDRSGALWIGTGGGLDRLDPATGQITHYRNDPGDAHSLSGDLILFLYEERSGALWIGTMGNGLSRIDPSSARFQHYAHDPQDPNSLGHNAVEAIWEDRDGVLWIGTGDGLDRFQRSTEQWDHYRTDPDDPTRVGGEMVGAILEDRLGTLWVGTASGGLRRFNRATGQFSSPDRPLDRSAVRALYEDREGLLWIGTHGKGISARDPETGQVTRYHNDPEDPNSLGNNWVFALHEDREGMLWIGTRDGGLDRFDRQTGQFTHFRHDPDDPQSLSQGAVQAIHQDRSGVLWVGTDGGGLNRFDRGEHTFARYGVNDGLPSHSILGILEDEQGYLWLSTGDGLSRFDPRTGATRNYDARDGTQGNAFVGGAAFRSERGEMFFGGFNGLNAFYPERIEDNPYIPPIVLTALTQSGQDMDAGVPSESVRQLTLRRPNAFFEFEYAALNYTQPEKNQYAYMLEGFEVDWHHVGTKRSGSYGNLPPGKYTLRMRGSNNDGVWNEEGQSIQVTVIPQFWETWWFLGLATLALGGGVVGAYQVRVRRIRARSRELEHMVEERTSQLEAFYLAEEKMHRHLHLDQVLEALADVAVEVLHADQSTVYVWDGEREAWVMRFARSLGPLPASRLTSRREAEGVEKAATGGEVIVVQDLALDPTSEQEHAGEIRSTMDLPIRVEDQTFAVFHVGSTAPEAFGPGRQRLFMALAQRAALAIENSRLYEQAQDLAALEERQRLARDLHDAVTQTLFSTSLIAEVLPRIWERDPDDARRRLEQIRLGTRSALAEMRTLLLELRPTGLTDAELGDLFLRLGEAISGRSPVSVTVDVEGTCTLPSDVHVALYRIAQEALNNVAKHAQATRAWVSLRCASGAAILSIRDDGLGFDPEDVSAEHLGLGIMRERAEEVGAVLTIESEPGQGTKVRAVWEADKECAGE